MQFLELGTRYWGFQITVWNIFLMKIIYHITTGVNCNNCIVHTETRFSTPKRTSHMCLKWRRLEDSATPLTSHMCLTWRSLEDSATPLTTKTISVDSLQCVIIDFGRLQEQITQILLLITYKVATESNDDYSYNFSPQLHPPRPPHLLPYFLDKLLNWKETSNLLCIRDIGAVNRFKVIFIIPKYARNKK